MSFKDSIVIVFWAILFLTTSCAKQGTPTGGPKDTIPPTIVRMSPNTGTVNFQGDRIEIEFNEYVEARDLKKELIINPNIKDYKFYTSRRTLFIDLQQPLQDSTTYTFNFRNGIKDISEGNSAKNTILAFSTGAYLDSFQVAGNVKQLMSQKPLKDAVVGMYPVDDTLTIFNSPPIYFTKADEKGNYLINYIKEGVYRIYAFQDANDNFQYESQNEALGFKANPLYLTADSVQNIAMPDSLLQSDSLFLADSLNKQDINNLQLYGYEVNMQVQKKDVRPVVIQSSRPNGKYYEIKFNKPLQSFFIETDDNIAPATLNYVNDSLDVNVKDTLPQYVYSNFQEQQQTIRVYNTLKQDSLRIFLNVQDSVEQVIEDTVIYVKFSETRRKSEELTQQFTTKKQEITNIIEGEVVFNKPMIHYSTDSILLVYDTLFSMPIDYEKALRWNKHQDKLMFRQEINKDQMLEELIVAKGRADSLMFIERRKKEEQYLDSLGRVGEEDAEERIRMLQEIVNLQNTSAGRTLLDSIAQTENEGSRTALINAFADSISLTQQPYQPVNYTKAELQQSLQPLTLYMAPGSFISVEKDSSQALRQDFIFLNPDDYGTIRGKIDTQEESYIIQLLDKNYKVMAETNSKNTYTFSSVQPGSYLIRVLIDSNKNGQWDDSNLLKDQEAEPVIVYDNYEINLKANWEQDLDLVF